MNDKGPSSERAKLTSNLQQLRVSIVIAESAFNTQLLLKPATDWLEDLSIILDDCEDGLQSKEENKPFDSEEHEKLVLWAGLFYDALNDGKEIEEDCIAQEQEELAEVVAAALRQLIAHNLEQVRIECWGLYQAAIGAA